MKHRGLKPAAWPLGARAVAAVRAFDTFDSRMDAAAPAPAVIRIAMLAAIFVATSLGCDREPPRPLTTAPAGPVMQLELKPLTPLLPNRPTHVVVDSLGNI